MSIFSYNGSAIVAMAGKDCVAIGSDMRLGVQLQTLSCNYSKINKIHDQLMIGLGGLATDALSLGQRLQFLHKLYKLREERDIKASSFGQLVSSELYSRRFAPYFASPVIAGLDPDGTPYICSMDTIGATSISKDFEVTGTANESLLGMCESLWKPDMTPDELFEVVSMCLLSGVDRDSLSGWGAMVYIITKDSITARTLKGRMD